LLYHLALKTVDGTLRARQPGEKTLRSGGRSRAGANVSGTARTDDQSGASDSPLAAERTHALALTRHKAATLIVIHKGPGNKATLLLPLGHLLFDHFYRPDVRQRAV